MEKSHISKTDGYISTHISLLIRQCNLNPLKMILHLTLFFSILPNIIAVAYCNSGQFFGPNETYCLRYELFMNDFQSAESSCKQLDGHLISIHDKELNDYLHSYAGSLSFWVGG